jgi:hypothetical protein
MFSIYALRKEGEGGWLPGGFAGLNEDGNMLICWLRVDDSIRRFVFMDYFTYFFALLWCVWAFFLVFSVFFFFFSFAV